MGRPEEDTDRQSFFISRTVFVAALLQHQRKMKIRGFLLPLTDDGDYCHSTYTKLYFLVEWMACQYIIIPVSLHIDSNAIK